MQEYSPLPRVLRFGVFEADLRSRELRKHGLKIKLQGKPFHVLAILLERQGELVTREELQHALWPADTFVDFDTNLNAAINKLREALGDSAGSSRFIETLPRLGYRFMVPVDGVRADLVPAQQAHLHEVTLLTTKGAVPKPPLQKRWPLAVAAAVLAVLAAGSWWLVVRRKPGAPPVIAVLPFKNLSAQPESDYFSEGLTDEVIHNLSIIDGLEVKSRTSSFAFKDKPYNIREVGEQLGVNLVLEGSVMRAGDRLRINADLVRVSDDCPLWSGRFDRELKDVFAIQDEISHSIVNELRLKLGGQRRYNTNPDVYDLYLKAEALANQTGSGGLGEREAGLKAIALFEQVIAKDPDFAPAYAGVADLCVLLSDHPRSTFEGAYEKGRVAAEKAMQLDPLLAEAHGDMGLFYARELAWDDAERSFRRAIQLNPNLPQEREEFAGIVLLPLGKLEEAVQQARKGVELDPLSPDGLSSLAWLLVSTAHDDEALEICRRVLPARPDDQFAQESCGRALMHKGRLDEAISVFEKLDARSHSFLGYAYAKAGRRAEAEVLAAENDVAAVRHQAVIHAGLGDKDRALDALERMAAMKDPVVDFYTFYPELALLRGDPRLNEIRRKRGLPAIQ